LSLATKFSIPIRFSIYASFARGLGAKPFLFSGREKSISADLREIAAKFRRAPKSSFSIPQ